MVNPETYLIKNLLNYRGAPALAAEYGLTCEMFEQEAHRNIFEIVIELAGRNVYPSLGVILRTAIEKGFTEITNDLLISLRTDSPHFYNFGYYTRIVQEDYIRRQLSAHGKKLTEAVRDGRDCFEILTEAEETLESVHQILTRKSEPDLEDLLMKSDQDAERAMNTEGTIGIPTGFFAYDRITGGSHGSHLIVIGARPKMGKTSFICQWIRNLCRAKVPVQFFSLEMKALEVVARLKAQESGVSGIRTKRGEISARELDAFNRANNLFAGAPLSINDTGGLDIRELQALARAKHKEIQTKVIFVDYVQLISHRGDKQQNREQEVNKIVMGLKNLAKELDVEVVALSQLNRKVEDRADKKPMVSDLRESGAIEQNADLIGLLYKPDSYGITRTKDGENLKGAVKLIIGANRHGPVDELKFWFHGPTFRFVNDDDKHLYGDYFSEFASTVYNPSEDRQDQDIDKIPF